MLIIKINSPKSKYADISKILGVKATSELNDWEYEIKDNSILKFHNILKSKLSMLNDINIRNEDVTIWLYYEYEGQCNIELSVKELSLLSSLKIDFCISCWEK
jgi:hypothetical protein